MALRRREKMEGRPRCHRQARRRARTCHQAFARTAKGGRSPQLLTVSGGSLGRLGLPPLLDLRAPARMPRSLPPAGTTPHPWRLMVTHCQCLESMATCRRHQCKEALPLNGSGIRINTRLHLALIKASSGGHLVHRQACHLERSQLALPASR